MSASYEERSLKVKGKNEVSRVLYQPKITVKVENNKIVLEAKKATQREKRMIYAMKAHAKNLFKGAEQGHTYKLKVCSGHFPMNISISNGVLTVKNFLGEAVPRTLKLKQGADVKLEGDIITVTANIKDIAGQQAGEIEKLTRITNRDRRIFQDGLYIIEKDGRPVS